MTIIFAILLFSFLIFIHELGHFVVAKLSGVQVNEFALFMGPAIYKKQVGETLYSLRCIPIGGYCAMEGEDEDTENPRSFQKAAWWKRLCILLAGAFMNFVTGVLLLAIVTAPTKQFIVPVIAEAEAGNTIIYEDGLHVGDRFLELDGEKIYLSSDFSTILAVNPGDYHDIVVERNGEIITFENYFLEKHEFFNSDGTTSMRFGFSFGVEDATFGKKVEFVGKSTVNIVRTVRLSLQMLFSGQAGLGDMMGPVGIVGVMSDTASNSETVLDAVLNLLYFGGFLGINLAIMNLLPIPALDGGRALCLILTVGYEKITKKKLNPKYEGYLHGVGMILLLALMGIILFKDVFQLFVG
ncbi:MAG: RIP metalloprotease RseP [Ruminococcaceae bacterium]|nr:RIP metalloprotease RseP [Oscillospiraceae bacterium]